MKNLEFISKKINIIMLIFFLVALTSRITLEITSEIVMKIDNYEPYNNIIIYFIIALFISLVILYLIRNTKLVSSKIVYIIILIVLLGLLVTNGGYPQYPERYNNNDGLSFPPD